MHARLTATFSIFSRKSTKTVASRTPWRMTNKMFHTCALDRNIFQFPQENRQNQVQHSCGSKQHFAQHQKMKFTIYGSKQHFAHHQENEGHNSRDHPSSARLPLSHQGPPFHEVATPPRGYPSSTRLSIVREVSPLP